MARRIIATDRAPAAVGPYSQAVVAGPFVFASGQLGLDPVTGKFVEGGVESQTRQAMRNLQAVLEAGGTNFAHVVKTTLFLANMDDFSTVNRVYAEFFSDDPPARATVEVSRLPLNALVEVEVIAYRS
ncbi:MAG: RidA family protein [Chloroflexi bacterium]|nr:RidA family protein [Chloroflexota bacterium]